MGIKGIEAIVKRYLARGHNKKDILEIIKEYESMPLTLPSVDEPVERISQVLTNNGYTTGPCEGIGRRWPVVFRLRCQDQDHLRHLAYFVNYRLVNTHCDWTLVVDSPCPEVNPDVDLCFLLQPREDSRRMNNENLMQDLDILGIGLIMYFNKLKEQVGEEEVERRAIAARGLRPIHKRVNDITSLFIVPTKRGTSYLNPRVEVLNLSEKEYRKRGTVVEEFSDGFEVQTDEVVTEWDEDVVVNESVTMKLRLLVCAKKDELITEWNGEVVGESRIRHISYPGLVYSFPVLVNQE